MAINLTATAKLNTAPFEAGINRLKTATMGLSTTQSAANAKAVSEVKQQQAARQAASVQRNSTVKQMTALENAAHAQQMSNIRQGLSAQRYLYGDMARMTARAALGLTAIPVAAVAAGVAWEKDFAEVVRTADPNFSENTKAIDALKSSLVGMVQAMPTSWGAVTEIATLANQMGIAATETIRFTQAASMFSATSGVSAEVTATAFGRLRAIIPDVGSDFMGLADSILKVGVNSVATEAEIINIVTQISSIAGAAQMSDKEIIGLSGAMASVRIPPELSRGVVTRVFGQMSRAVSDGGSSLEGFAKIAGMTGDQFAESWGVKGKSGDAFISFMDGLRKLGPAAEAELRALGITSVRDVPVMLRLASAADSEGVIGGLLKQTNRDAKDAAGETQRQYSIMAETVSSKLKVVGNNLMAFFSAISQTGMGPFGAILDYVADSIKKVTNSLDDAHKLFGVFEMPFTNAEAIGAATTIGLIAASMLGLGSAALKMREAMAGTQLLWSALSGGGGKGRRGGDPTGMGRVTAQWVAAPGQIRTAGRKFNQAVATTYAGAAGYVDRYTNSVAKANSRIAGKAPGKMQFPAFDSEARAADRYNTALARTGNAFTSMSDGIGRAARGIGSAAAFAFGPWGLAAAIGIGAVATWIDSTKAASTTSSELAEGIAKAGNNVEVAAQRISEITIGGAFGEKTQVFKDGYISAAALNKELDKMAKLSREAVLETPGSATPGMDGMSYTGNAIQNLVKKHSDNAKYAESVKVIDEAFSELAGSGNAAMGLSAISKFAGGSKNLFDLLESSEAKNMKKFFTDAFDMAGVEYTEQNLQKLSRGAFPEIQEQLYGIQGAAALTFAELASFDGDGFGDSFAAVASAIEETAAAFIDYKAALTVAGDDTSLAQFNDVLEAQMKTQKKWGENLSEVAKFAGNDVVKAIAEMGIEAAPMLDQLVEDFKASGGSVEGEWKRTVDNIVQSTEMGAGQMAPLVGAAADVLRNTLKDANLSEELIKVLNPDDMTTLSRAFEGLGRDAAQQLGQGIMDGKLSVEQAVELAMAATRPKLNIDEVEVSPEAASKIDQQIQDFATRNDLTIPAEVEINSDMTVRQFKEMVGKPDLFPVLKTDAELDLKVTDAYMQYESVRSYMISNGIDVELAANPELAFLEYEAFKMYVEGQVSYATIEALTEKAQGAMWEFVTLNDGTVVAVQIDADTGQALAKDAQVVSIAGTEVDKPIAADTAQAEAAVAKLDAEAKAEQTKTIVVTDNGTAAAIKGVYDSIKDKSVTVSIHRNTISTEVEQADGGVMQYYANGGVRENHIAQIAPAGTMRMWAEPETGGEAYIPLAKSKRLRSTAILEDVANRFGMALTPQNYTKYADGGQYNAQLFSRARYAGATSQRGDSPVDERRDIKMTFVNPVVRDPFKDAWERTQELGVRL